MNEIMKALKERRSIRKYKKDLVPQELLDQIIEAGLYAASGKNQQAAIIISVTNKELLSKLSAINREIGGFPENVDPFYGAPAALIVLGKKSWPTHVEDGSLVLGNMMLAAHALGLGSCWINRAKQEFEMDEYKQILKDLGIEEEYAGVGHLIVGYIDGEYPEAAERKENRVYYIK